MADLLTSQDLALTRYTLSDYLQWRVDAVSNPFAYSPFPPVVTYNGNRVEQVEDNYTALATYAYRGTSVVAACMRVRRDLFRQARFCWRELTDTGPGRISRTDELGLLDRPWPNGTTGELLTRMITDVDLCGNSFIANEGDRLRWLRPDWVSIVLTGDPLVDDRVDVMGYVYTPGGADVDNGVAYEPGEVCHWAPDQDPLAFYRGMSWVSRALEEIHGDRAATTHKLSFFRHGATLGPIIRVPAGVSREQFKEFIAESEAAHVGADNAYRPFYVGGGAEVSLAMADFRQLDLKAVQGGYETRVAAVAGVHPVLVGLSEGLQGSSLNSGNFAAARRATAEMTLFTLWQDACGALQAFFTPPDDAELWIRERDIPFLREERKDQAEITKTRMLTIEAGVRAGYKPDALVRLAETDDVSVLIGQHSNLFSVQLQPAGQTGPVEQPDFGALREQPIQAQATTGVALGQEGVRAITAGPDDEVVRALIDAFDELERRYNPDQLRIPKGYEGGGRFRNLVQALTKLLEGWVKGEGPDDPLDKYTPDQLRKVAAARGLVGKGERLGPPDSAKVTLKTRLYNDIRSQVKQKDLPQLVPEGKPAAKKPAKKAAAPKKEFDRDEVAEAITLGRVVDGRRRKLDRDEVDQELAGLNLAQLRRVAVGVKLDVPESGPDGKHWTRDALAAHIADRVMRDRLRQDQEEGHTPKAKVAKTPAFDPAAVAAKVNDQQSEAEIIQLLSGDPQLTAAKLRRVADKLGINVPDDVKSKGALQLHIAEEVARERDLPGGFGSAAAKKATPAASKPAGEGLTADVDRLRALGDPEAIRDDLDLKKLPELKELAGHLGVAKSGRKRDLVDRLVDSIGRDGAKPAAKKAAKAKPKTGAAEVRKGDFSDLRRVGKQLGSNEGGIFEAPDGSRWYVKAQKSAEHANNEALASSLYRAGGVEVPEVVRGTGTPGLPGEHHTATRLVGSNDIPPSARMVAVGDETVALTPGSWPGNNKAFNVQSANGRAIGTLVVDKDGGNPIVFGPLDGWPVPQIDPDSSEHDALAALVKAYKAQPVEDLFGDENLMSKIGDDEEVGPDEDYLRLVHAGFAMDAWLANWDVVGLNFDNILESPDHKPVRVDAGGSLLFRAQGVPKGAAFGPSVQEWDSLRDSGSAAQAARIFGGIDRLDLIASADRVKAVTPAKIRKLVADHDMDPALADLLIRRRKDLLSRARAEAKGISRWEVAQSGFAVRKAAPISKGNVVDVLGDDPTIGPARAGRIRQSLENWQDGEYVEINRALVKAAGFHKLEPNPLSPDVPQYVEDIRTAMRHSKLTHDVLVYRGDPAPARFFPPGVWSMSGGMEGMEWTHWGFWATSSSEETATAFSTHSVDAEHYRLRQPTLLRILAPKGTRAVWIEGGESELVLTDGLRYRVVKDRGVVGGYRRIDVEVVT